MTDATVTTEWKVKRLREIGAEIAALLAEQHALITGIGDDPAMSLDDRMATMHQVFATSDLARLERVLEMTQRTKRTIYRWMDEKGFPRPEQDRGVNWWSLSAVKTWWAEHEGELGRWPS